MRTTRTSAGAIALLLSGCGTIMHGARQNVMVQSSPSGATIQSSPGTGTFTTPTNLSLERKNSYVLTFSSPGYAPATFNVNNKIGAGTVIADVLLTGLIGVVVDGATGAWYSLAPDVATVTMTRTSAGDEPEEIHVHISRAPNGRGVGITSDVPAEVRVQVDRKRR